MRLVSSNTIYILVTLAAVTRVAATVGADWAMPLLIGSACLWIAAFTGFVFGYGPMLLFRPRLLIERFGVLRGRDG